MKRVLFVALVVALGAAGCGGANSGVSEKASAELDTSVGRIRVAAAAQDRTAADQALAELQGRVEELGSQGEISDAAAARILDAAGRVQAELAAIPTPTTPAPATVAPPQTAADPDEDRGRDRDNRDEKNDKHDDDDD